MRKNIQIILRINPKKEERSVKITEIEVEEEDSNRSEDKSKEEECEVEKVLQKI